MDERNKPVIIIGAGIVGLTLACGLSKAGIPFQVFERDEDIESRSQGWAITLHWALSFLRDMLDEETLVAIDEVQVDPAVGRNDNGNFVFLNLESLETKFRIPPNERRRVNREGMRRVLVKKVQDHIHWGKRLVDIETPKDPADGVRALFADGTEADGRIIIGADGAHSSVRKLLLPETYQNYELPVTMLGAAVKMTPQEVKPLRDIDPLLFQGCHPTTGIYMWISMMSTPETNGSVGTSDEHFLVQMIMSWITKDGQDTPNPTTDTECVATVKRLAANFHPVLQDALAIIPESYPVSHITISDWPCHPWDNRDGRVTLISDAAHAMTMFRGEAANHGILDARNLLRGLAAVYQNQNQNQNLESSTLDGEKTLKEALDEYDKEVWARGVPAVLLSREACLGAHDFHGLNENSAVLKRRMFTT